MTCPKIRYSDRTAALIALASSEAAAKLRKGHQAKKRREVRVYRCPRCKGWHLTSESDRAAV